MKNQTDIAKDQHKFFKLQANVNINNKENDIKTEDDAKIEYGNNRVEDMSNESNITKGFDAILKYINNDGRTAKTISAKIRDNNISLQPLIIKLLNAEKAVFKKEYGSDETFNIFDEIDKKCNELSEYNPRNLKKIDTKIVMLKYLKVTEDKIIYMFSTPSIIRKKAMSTANDMSVIN